MLKIRKAGSAVGKAGLAIGEGVAVSIGLAEAIFFCAYAVALPFLILMALVRIPHWLREHVQAG